MSYLRHQQLGFLLWHRAFAEWLIRDLRALAPTVETEHEVENIERLLGQYSAEIQRRHDLAARVARAWEGVV